MRCEKKNILTQTKQHSCGRGQYASTSGIKRQIGKGNLKENGYIFIYPKKKKHDNRKWRLSLIADAPEGVEMLTMNDIQEIFDEIEKQRIR